MACEPPVHSGVPLLRWSSVELAREAVTRGIVEQISGVTVWRWLSEDAIKPWQHRSWIFPRDPHFTRRAGPILDLYAGYWQGERLHPGDYRLSSPRQTLDRPPPRHVEEPDRRAHPRPRLMAQSGRDLLLRRATQSRHPNDFADLDTLEQHLLAFGRRYEQIASPLQSKFTRQDLHKLLAKTDTTRPAAQAA